MQRQQPQRDFQYDAVVSNYAISVNGIYLAAPYACAVCRGELTHVAVALGEPYHALVHRRCLPAFPFGRWPHALPHQSYLEADERESVAALHSHSHHVHQPQPRPRRTPSPSPCLSIAPTSPTPHR